MRVGQFTVTRTPIVIGQSGASVCRVEQDDGSVWFEKCGPLDDIAHEVAVLNWCDTKLPVPNVLSTESGCLAMTALPGVNLTEVSVECAIATMAEALRLIHAVPLDGCPFDATWTVRLELGRRRVLAGLVDEADFDTPHMGRTAADILFELESLPAPPDVVTFTHGDACLPNVLTDGRRLTGIVDVGRAGRAHPAQDWALALRSTGDNLGADAARLLREHVPESCADENLLRQFRLLDELF